MSDVTRKPGGTPAEPDRQTPDVRGGTAPDPVRTDDAYPAPGARADHAAGTRADVTPGLRADDPAGTAADTAETGGTGGRSGGTGETGSAGRTGSTPTPAAHDEALLAHEECDRFGQRLHHAVAGFVDAPRASVEEADRVLEELTARFTDAVAQRRRTLRTSWRDTDADDRATSTDTEQLRLALRDYRELADRLMRV
jgi:hypothetical protein